VLCLLESAETGQLDLEGKLEMNDDKRMDVLNRLEAGEIDAEQAIQALGEDQEHAGDRVDESIPEKPSGWRAWWLILFSLGIAGTAAGLGLSQLGGWWWVCAGPLLVVSVIVVILAAATSQSPWVDVRIRTGSDDGYRKFNINLPLPVRLTAWGLRIFGGNIPGLDDTAVDELIMSLEGNISPETPIHIQVHDDEDGEHVEVFVG
jgi:hypothetical protein